MKATPAEPDAALIQACPYRGLVPYFEDDADYFFGRQSDTQIIVANCMTTRVTLFYGASGVGKSSVLYAGVMRELGLRARANLAQRNCPECVGVAFSSWRDNPIDGLLDRIEATLRKMLPAEWLGDFPPRGETLAESLRAWTEFMKSDLVLLLDQFEEYFLYRDAHDLSFADALIAVVNDPDLRVNVLISLREDALARLDTLKASIPSLFANGLRLEHLTVECARLAIEGPLKLYNERLAPGLLRVTIEPELVNELLGQVQAGRVRLRQAGAGVLRFGSGIVDKKARVEAPYLQMVMMRLWREDIARGSQVLRFTTLASLGGAEKILRTHLDVVMAQLPAAEQALAAKVFHQLVTPGGTKIAHYVNDLAAFAHAPVASVARMCELLEGWKARVLRDVTPPGMEWKRYEIFHDLLAAPILDWRQRRVAEDERRGARKKWALRIGAAFGICALMAGSVIAWLWIGKNSADQTAETATKAKEAADTKVTRVLGDTKVLTKKLQSRAEMAPPPPIGPGTPEIVKAAQSMATEEIARKEPVRTVGRLPIAAGGDSQLSILPEVNGQGAPEFSNAKIDSAHERDVWNADYATLADPGARPTFLITAGRDKTAFVMDLVGDSDFFLTGHSDEVNAALINPNAVARMAGWFAATASDDATARVWKFGPGAAFAELRQHKHPLTGLAWSRDGRWLVTASKDHTAIIWDLGMTAGTRPHPARVLSEGTASVWQPGLVETAQGAWLVTPCGDGKAYLYTFPEGKLIRALDHGAAVRRAVISPDGKFVLTAGADGRAVLWNRETGEALSAAVHKEAVRDVVFDATGRYFATGSADGTAQVWDVATAVQKHTGLVVLKGHTAPIFSIAFTPGGPGLVTTSWDRTARIWNFEEKRCIAVCTGHTSVLWTVKFSPKGSNFCTTGADGTTRIWDLKKIPGAESLRSK